MTTKKIAKVLITAVIITLPLPLILFESHTVDYGTLGKRMYHMPRVELFSIPIFFLILLVLLLVWRNEIDKFLEK